MSHKDRNSCNNNFLQLVVSRVFACLRKPRFLFLLLYVVVRIVTHFDLL